MKLQSLNLFEEAPVKNTINNPTRNSVWIKKNALIARPTYRAKRSHITHVKPGDTIFWTQPVKIYSHEMVGGREDERYAMFGFNGPERANAIGLIPVSVASRAPSLSLQPRVATGAEAQRNVVLFIKRLIKEKMPGQAIKVDSVSAPGSQEPDIVMTIGDERVQFEVKHRTGGGSLTTVFNKFVRRGDSASPIDHVVKLMTGKNLTLEKLIDHRRKKDKTQGFPEDPGVTNVSGSFTPLTIKNDNPRMAELTEYLKQFFTSSGDNYFVLHYGSKNVRMFFTGYGRNVLNMPSLDTFDLVKLDTYGAGYNGAIRMAVKVKFPSVVSEGIHLADFIE